MADDAQGVQQLALVQVAGAWALSAPNHILTPPQDMQCVENCTNPDPSTHVLYEQPVWQTLQMFGAPPHLFSRPALTNRASRRNALSVTDITPPLHPNHVLPVFSSQVSSPSYTRGCVPPVRPVALHDDPPKHAPLPLQGRNILLLWIPAACDLTGTTVRPISFTQPPLTIPQLMNVGLLYTPVSIYQMTRGALVLFVGVFSVLFSAAVSGYISPSSQHPLILILTLVL